MKGKRLIIWLLAGMLTGLAGCRKSDKDAAAMGTPEVAVAQPVVDSITLYKTFPGYLKARDEATVVARVNGTLLSKNYTEGSYVSKGQVLFTIESTSYRDAVNQAQAQLNTAQANLAYARREYEAMSKALLSDAVAEMNVVQAKSEMQQAEASVKNAQAALSTARTNLGYCTVTAPISGHISEAKLDVGQYVGGAAQPVELATIYDDSVLQAEFSVEASDAGFLSDAGSRSLLNNIPLKFKEKLSKPYTASLAYVDPSVNLSTGSMLLKGNVDNSSGELRSGMYVTVNLPYGTNPHAVLVRDASIGTDQRGKYLYCVTDSNTVKYTPVTLGPVYQDTLRVVESGITPETRYVTTALLTVRPGMKVKPIR